MAEKSGVKTSSRDHIGAFLISMPLFAAPKISAHTRACCVQIIPGELLRVVVDEVTVIRTKSTLAMRADMSIRCVSECGNSRRLLP